MKYERGSFVTVPSKEVLRGLHPSAQVVYFWLCAYANETGNCFPSRSTLAKDTGCSEKTVDRMLLILEQKGLIKKRHQKSQDGDYASNLYTVLVVGGGVPESLPSRPTVPTVASQSRTNSNQETKPIVIVAEATSEKKVTPQMKAVFSLFLGNPARLQWDGRVYQRRAAQVLYDSYGVDELKTRYQIAQKYKDDQHCPQIDNPSDFLEKMPKMEKFLKDLQRV